MLALNARAGTAAIGRDARRLVLGALRAKADLPRQLAEIQAIADAMAAETATWATPADVATGRGGKFDACDLRHWLRSPSAPVCLRSRRGLSSNYRKRKCRSPRELSASRSDIAASLPLPPSSFLEISNRRICLRRRMPTGCSRPWPRQWIRCPRVGWSGMSVRPPALSRRSREPAPLAPEPPKPVSVPTSKSGPGGSVVAIGAASTSPITGSSNATRRAPDGPSVFVARPWITAGRLLIGEDPHRAGTKLAGPGVWPAEWRAFVFDGKVTGVAAYYGWAGDVSPIAATNALKVRELAGRIVAEAARQGAIPLYPAMEILRLRSVAHPRIAEILARFKPDRIDCTIDFLETEDGPIMLEAGPAHYPAPIGGGHPCAFAGARKIEGVAYRCPDGVLIADPATWHQPANISNAILSWEATAELAANLTNATTGP